MNCNRSNHLILFILVYLPLSFFILPSCNKSGSDPGGTTSNTQPVVTGPDVYVSGTIHSGNSTVAAYWKNSTIVGLADAKANSTATGIYVLNNDVYVSGNLIVNGVNNAVFWKNGILTILGPGGATGITIQGTDVYVIGFVYVGSSHAAAYWKNGVSTMLTNPVEEISSGKPSSIAESIVVQGTDTYIAGWGDISYGGGDPVALYWKNSTPTLLTKYYSGYGNLNALSQAHGICLNGSDVYIVGSIIPASSFLSTPQDISGAVYWKNGVGTAIFNNSMNSSASWISAQGSDLYIGGFTGSISNGYFKNGNLVQLSSGNLSVSTTAICFYSGDAYVLGNTAQNNATLSVGYWENGNFFNLNSPSATVTGITVVAHQ